jgi:hypothetical protein
MTFTISGRTEAEIAAQSLERAGHIQQLKALADHARSAVQVDTAEAQAISRQQSMGARPGYGSGSSPVEQTRQAKLAELQSSDAAKLPGLIREQRAAQRAEAERRLVELRGAMAQPGDAAQETRNERMLGLVRTRLPEGASITQALPELDRVKDNRSHLGLVRDELQARYPEHAALIDQHITRLDPELAAAQRDYQTSQHDYVVIDQAARAVENGIKTGNLPSSAYFDNVAKAVFRQ